MTCCELHAIVSIRLRGKLSTSQLKKKANMMMLHSKQEAAGGATIACFRLLIVIYTVSVVFFLFCARQEAEGSTLDLPANWAFSPDLSLESVASSSNVLVNAYSLAANQTLFAPILSSAPFSSGKKGFSFGFLALIDNHSSVPSTVFLSVCLGTSKKDARGAAFAVPVWQLNLSRPLRQVGQSGLVSLGLNSNRELVLRDGDGRLVWQLQGPVASMEMQEAGALVIYGGNNSSRNSSSTNVLWQSQDHPGDSMVAGQVLGDGSRILSNNSHYVIEMMAGGLIFYMVSSSPVPLGYWFITVNSTVDDYLSRLLGTSVLELSRNPTVNVTEAVINPGDANSCASGGLPVSNHSFARFQGTNLAVFGEGSDCSYNFTGTDTRYFYNPFPLNSTLFPSDFFRLENDGIPRGYTYIQDETSREHYIFSGRENFNICFTPDCCGPYGICSQVSFGAHRMCRCPSQLDNSNLTSGAFAFVDPNDASQGCKRSVPLTCSNSSNHFFVELNSTTLVSIGTIFEVSSSNTQPLSECQNSCSTNCSCSGFFYHYGTSFCLPFGDSPPATISNVSFFSVPSVQFSSFLKMQSPPNTTSNKSSSPHPAVIAAVALLAVIVLVVLFLLLYSAWRHNQGCFLQSKGKRSAKHEEEEEDDDGDDDGLQGVLLMLPNRYSYHELHKVTNGFTKLIGSGGFGSVYEGVLLDGRKVAVKKLDMPISPRLNQFIAEVATISGIRHYNIVGLLGFCSEGSDRLLVYEYMENGSLDQWLFQGSSRSGSSVYNPHRPSLDWATRFSVAVGTARGLVYLHEESPQPIIHFDVKPQNILLDEHFVPKLSDFGLAKLVKRGSSSAVMTAVRGTPGYLAPEWLSFAVVSRKCDVYSFGMVLLELVGGRKNVDSTLIMSYPSLNNHAQIVVEEEIDEQSWYFPVWAALKCRQGKMMEIVDKRLDGLYDAEQVKRIIHVAFLCIQKDPACRPSMGTVLKMLEGSLELSDELPLTTRLEAPPVIQVGGSPVASTVFVNGSVSDVEAR